MSDLERIIEEIARRVLREELAAMRDTAHPELVSVQAYAAARSISVGKVRAAIARGEIAAVKIGRAVRVRRDAEIARPIEQQDTPELRARAALAQMRGGRK